jgi:hypothetical protein
MLGGVLRNVPADAQIRVHQTWPKDRRDDAMAATYSAREWVAGQRQLGQLARYTIEMGGDIALFETAMRVPPWEALRPLTTEEIRRMALSNAENPFDKTAAKSPATKPVPSPPAMVGTMTPSNVSGSSPAKASSWQIVEQGGVLILARQFPLTLDGEEIGHFEISFACGGSDDYKAAYTETRRIAENTAMRLTGVGLGVGGQMASLPVGSSVRNLHDVTIDSIATGTASVAFITELMRDGGQVLGVATVDSNGIKTNIKIGRTGLSDGFKHFVAKCKSE